MLDEIPCYFCSRQSRAVCRWVVLSFLTAMRMALRVPTRKDDQAICKLPADVLSGE